jgi:hypothetical protein
MVARVTMIGGIFSKATKIPLPTPKPTPTNRPMRMASGAGTPATISPVVRVPDNAITGPTERSMPPVRITQVMPTAMIALIETWRAMFSRLAPVRNLSLAKIMKTVTTTRPTKG